MRKLILLPALFLTACLGMGGGDDQPKLQGTRIDVTLQPSALAAESNALAEAFRIPPATAMENWGQNGANATHTPGHVELPQSVIRAWSVSLGGGSGKGASLTNPPIVHSGRVFAVNTKGEITALNAKNGKQLWQISLPLKEEEQASLAGGIAVSGNLLFATTGDGQVFALSADKGKQVWKTDLAVPLRAAPTVDGEKVFVTSHDNRVFALNALDGAMLWTHSGMEEPLSTLAASSPAAGNGLVAVPYSSGEIYVLRETDGRYLWHDTLTSAFSGQDPQSTVAAIAAPPVMADGLLYAVGLNGGLSAYNISTGQRFWKADILTSQLPIVAGYQIFALTDKGEMVGLNRRDGAIRWVTDLNKDLAKEDDAKRLWTGPVLAGNRLIAGSSDGYAISIDPESGKRLAATKLGDGVSLPPVVANGSLYFLTDEAELICFRAK